MSPKWRGFANPFLQKLANTARSRHQELLGTRTQTELDQLLGTRTQTELNQLLLTALQEGLNSERPIWGGDMSFVVHGLLDAGACMRSRCPQTAQDMTPIMLAVQCQENIDIIRKMLTVAKERGHLKECLQDIDSKKRNVFHLAADFDRHGRTYGSRYTGWQTHYTRINGMLLGSLDLVSSQDSLKTMSVQKGAEMLGLQLPKVIAEECLGFLSSGMLDAVDSYGATPLNYACRSYERYGYALAARLGMSIHDRQTAEIKDGLRLMIEKGVPFDPSNSPEEENLRKLLYDPPPPQMPLAEIRRLLREAPNETVALLRSGPKLPVGETPK